MTGLVRKATLLGVCGLFIAASAAFAFVPDPATSTVAGTIYVVTPVTAVSGGAATPDVDGANGPTYAGNLPPLAGTNTSNVIVIKDFAGNPISGVGVHIKFPCDINLCTVSPGAPYTTTYSQTVSCTATGNVLNAVTDAAGRVEFVAFGAAKDPGGAGRLVGGGTNNSTLITVDGYVGTFKTASAAALDQNGAAGVGAGVTAADASIVLATALSGGALADRARANLDGAGIVTALDASIELGHGFRLTLATTNGCAGNYCAKNPCP